MDCKYNEVNPFSKVLNDCITNVKKYKDNNPLEWKNYELNYNLNIVDCETSDYSRQLQLCIKNDTRGHSIPIFTIVNHLFINYNIVLICYNEFYFQYRNSIKTPYLFDVCDIGDRAPDTLKISSREINKILYDILRIRVHNTTGQNYLELIQ